MAESGPGPGGARRRPPAIARASSRSCRRTLGFLSNFAIAFSFISVSTGTFGNFGVGIGLGRAGVLLVVADRHHRPVARRARVRRAGEPLPGRRLDLPVVEAPVEPDARLVHRLVLLLGPGRDGHRGRGHRRRSSSTASTARSGRARRSSTRPTRPASRRCSRSSRSSTLRHHDADQRVRRPAAVDPQQHRRRRPRSSGMLVFALILLFFANHQSPGVLFDTGGHGGARPAAVPAGVRARHVHGAVRRLRLRHRRARSARRRVDASRQAPRGVLSSISISGVVGTRLPARRSSSRSRTCRPRSPRARRSASRSRRRSRRR